MQRNSYCRRGVNIDAAILTVNKLRTKVLSRKKANKRAKTQCIRTLAWRKHKGDRIVRPADARLKLRREERRAIEVKKVILVSLR